MSRAVVNTLPAADKVASSNTDAVTALVTVGASLRPAIETTMFAMAEPPCPSATA